MKQTTQQIYELINNQDLNDSLQKLKENYDSSQERNELSLVQAIDNFLYMKEIISEACENGQIDNLALSYKRQIQSNLNNLFSYRNNWPNAIDGITNLYTYFLTYNLESFKHEKKTYNDELLNAIKEKREYRKISQSLRKGIKYVNEIEPKYKEIIEIEEDVKKSYEEIDLNRKKTNEIKENILITQKEVDSKKIVIDNTYESANETREILKNSEKNAKELKEKFQGNYNTFFSNTIAKNENLQSENISIQQKVKELLQGATGGKLHEGFITRKKELQKTLNIWLLGIILLNIFILFFSFSIIYGTKSFNIGPFVPSDNYFPEIKSIIVVISLIAFLIFLFKKYLFKQEKYTLKIPQLLATIFVVFLMIQIIFEGISTPNILKIEFSSESFYGPIIKLLITIPLIVLDWFLIKEYSYRKDFVEKYTFKSAISLSLFAYRELIEKEHENPEAIKFINNSIEKIYKDPFENEKYSLAKKEKDLLNSFVENLSQKIIKNGD